MKKILLFVLTIGVVFSACKKDYDYAFDKSPDERINEALATYQTKLAGAENGWKALITVDSGKGGTYSFYFKFNDENRVTMVSDFDSTSAATPKESSYRLKAQQQPTLIFDTYSYIHVLADPNENVVIYSNVNGGPIGEGLLSDFEFIFDNSQIKEDTIRMNGKVHNAKLVMIKATKAESDGYLGGQFTLFSELLNNKILTYFKRMTIGAQQYDVAVDASGRTITFTWLDGSGNPQSFTTGYYNTLDGVKFNKALVNGAQTIGGFSNASFDEATSTLSLNAGTQTGTITPIVVPLYVDKTAAERWWQTAYGYDTYWISIPGFHVNGKDDGFNVRSLASYYYSIYWPDYEVGSNDLFAPVFLNAAQNGLQLKYGVGPLKPTYTADGRAIFKIAFTYGTNPTTGPAKLSNDQLAIPEGYYFVKINDFQYDMVSAKDGKAWIRWEL